MKDIKVSIIKYIEINDSIVSRGDIDKSYYEGERLYECIKEAIEHAGGFPDKIKKAKKLLIKPNLLTAAEPRRAVTTHPEVVRHLVRILREEGINDISIGDSPAGSHSSTSLWEKTGFAKLAKEENITLLPFENIKRTEISGIGYIPVLKELDEFDAVISVPKLKTHTLTKITAAVKNSYGLIVGGAKSHFHSTFPSPKQMAKCIAQIYPYLKPDFVLMDAVVCMEGEGPSMGKPAPAGLILASADALAVDICACEIYNYKYYDIPLLKILYESEYNNGCKILRTGSGAQQIQKLHLKHSKSDILHKIPDIFFHLITQITFCRPSINQNTCKKCGICAEICSQNAILKTKDKYKVNSKRCILCMCCIEACPHHAIQLTSLGMRITNFLKKFLTF